ncbi:hybrid sensor histidine kinase/response regulator [Paracoccus albus]|uniref:hybrid sensor histidine kinase/response regulator n=1 Tax=Paracoccus albus TaxID=3017784 RepID=UPI0022F116C3|nr:ATP-binding protein [Paracoccus albus]WBU61058.1 ATP-binding protein [Paracoccus albus]
MTKLLKRWSDHRGLSAAFLVLPVIAVEIILHAAGTGITVGSIFLVIGAMALLGSYFVGGGLLLVRLRRGFIRLDQLADLRPAIAATSDAEWAVDSDEIVMAQSPLALEQWGDFIGRPLSQLLSGQVADAEKEAARMVFRALRHDRIDLSLPSGGIMRAERAGQHLAHLTFLLHDSKDTMAADLFDYDRLPFAILRLSDDGTVQKANRAASAYCKGDVAGTHISELFDGLGRPFADWLAEVAQSRALATPEVLRAQSAGQDRFIQVSLYPMDEECGGLIAVLSDAKAMKTLEAQFVQSQKMQAVGQLAGGIAHDFNNLLTAIGGHCDLLMLRHDKGDPDFADLDQIRQNANRAAYLVGHLLAFSRKQTLKPQYLDLRETLSDLSHLLNRLVGEKIVLGQSHDPNLDIVRADRGKFEQVIVNLVVNARDAMPAGGRIEITTSNFQVDIPEHHDRFTVPPGNYVKISVADQGKGIEPDVISKIFEPFFTTKRIGEGTGLGLSTAYGIVKQSGGYILCESQPLQGTTFTVYLPAHIGDVPTPSCDDAVSQTVNLEAKAEQHVLLVEDEAPVRAFASRALKMRGYRVTEASSGEEALSLLADDQKQIDLFVSDVVMPGMDGVAWVRAALKDRPETPVIFMSGYTEDVFDDGRNPISNATFLQKPFSLTDLITSVGERLEGKA